MQADDGRQSVAFHVEVQVNDEVKAARMASLQWLLILPASTV